MNFFRPLLEDLQADDWVESVVNARVWYRSFESGIKRITFGAGLWPPSNETYVNVWLNLRTAEAKNRVYDALHDEQAQIESDLGIPGDSTEEARWNRRDGNSFGSININMRNPPELGEADDEIRSWMKEYLDKLYTTFTPRLERIMAGQGADSDEG